MNSHYMLETHVDVRSSNRSFFQSRQSSSSAKRSFPPCMPKRLQNKRITTVRVNCRNAISGEIISVPSGTGHMIAKLAQTLNLPQQFVQAVEGGEEAVQDTGPPDIVFLVVTPQFDYLDPVYDTGAGRCTICGDPPGAEPLLDRDCADDETCERCCPEYLCILCRVFIGGKPVCLACLEEGEESFLPDTRRLRALEDFWHLMDSFGRM